MTEIEDIPLSVADPEAAARFYSGLLRRRPLEAGPDRAVFVLAPGRTLSLWRAVAPASWQNERDVEFRMEAVSSVDELHIDWWDRGARILLPPMDMSGGRGFLARDPDGNRLRVFAAG
ncbi:VOC family protein [Brevundimonas sp.]|uniref:VOC family protein n=1 Tax=Brevundimonas sp. TaxID=1871086 RepID=UPI0017C6C3AE|nr:VOC family protein [Brevundimonas sp.]MBA4808049.1 VOC family protein [Brevundimonas sp.]